MLLKTMLAVSALLVTLPAAYPSAEAGAADCPWCQAKPPSKPVIFACQNRPRSKCEWSIGQQYLSIGFFAEAKEHCGKALQAQASIDSQRHARFASRLTYIAQLIDDKDLDKAESELKALRAYEADEDKKFGPLKDEDVRWLDSVAGRLASESVWPWDIKQFDSHFLKLPPGVARQIWRIQAFLGFLIAAFAAFWIARWICWLLVFARIVLWNSVRWMVIMVEDDGKRLAVGALMDALNVTHNPLFQQLETSSFLAAPPSITSHRSAPSSPRGPSFAVWRDFRINVKQFNTNGSLTAVRPHISRLFEEMSAETFIRHKFKQAAAFEEISVKLGPIEANLGALYRLCIRWWTKGWPTVAGSVAFDTVGEKSFAYVRLVANHRMPHIAWQSNKYPNDPEPSLLIDGEGTLAVYASTETDQVSDAVALSSQRAAFRLLFRLVKRPAEPNLAIAASSYRQGVRLLNDVL